MSGSFLYFLPHRENEQCPTIAKASEMGIGYAFESDKRIEKRRILGGGPGGTAGLLLFDGATTPADRGKINLPAQTWRKFTPMSIENLVAPSLYGGVPNAWVGYWSDSPPVWRDLRRDQLIDGREVLVDGGQSILIPTARQFAFAGPEQESVCYSCGLPKLLDMDADGRLVQGDVVSRYRRLWTLATEYDQVSADAVSSALDASDGSGDVVVRFEFPQMNRLIHECLVCNHRAGLQELLLLKQYDVQFRQRVVDVLLDNDTWVALQKKTVERRAERESMISSVGPGESKPDGTPPMTNISPASESGGHSRQAVIGLMP